MPAPNITKTANNYDMVLGSTWSKGVYKLKNGQPDTSTFSETVSIGDKTSKEFVHSVSIPRWGECLINYKLQGEHSKNFTAAHDGKRVTTSNEHLTIIYTPTGRNKFNEWGGFDEVTVINHPLPDNKLTYEINLTNVNAYLQPSLTLEWTVGQDLGNGNTVANVTDTDVTDNLGNNVAHRPDYVVNSIAFMNATNGGMVSDVQAATGLTTGKIGMLYRMKMTGANGVTAWADWSIPNGTNLWLNLNTTGMTYPIVISPAGDTFGYSSIAGTQYTWAGGSAAIASIVNTRTAVSGDTITSFSLYCSKYTSDDTDYLAAYTVVSGHPTSLLSSVTSISVTAYSASWVTTSTVSQALVASSVYCVAMSGDSLHATNIYYNSGSPPGNFNSTYTSLQSTFGYTGSDDGKQYSIYCTYTAGGGYIGPNNIYPHILAH